jgi:SPOR domain
MLSKFIIYTIFIPIVLAACTGPNKTSTTPATPTTSSTVKKKISAKKIVDGYQLQVLNTIDRNEALKAKSLLLSKYPQQKTILLFQSPYYKIRFGNFLDKADAVTYQKKIKSYFTNVFVIPVKIEIKVEE